MAVTKGNNKNTLKNMKRGKACGKVGISINLANDVEEIIAEKLQNILGKASRREEFGKFGKLQL